MLGLSIRNVPEGTAVEKEVQPRNMAQLRARSSADQQKASAEGEHPRILETSTLDAIALVGEHTVIIRHSSDSLVL